MYIGSFYCNTHTLYNKDGVRVELGDLSEIYDPDFGGYLTVDGTQNGEPLFGLYAPYAFFKGRLVLAGMDLDDLNDGDNYGRILSTSIEAGKILLSESVGTLDDIEDGAQYGKVAVTSIESGRIIVAGLDSGVTARMFSNSNIKSNIEAWKHNSDITMIDGGKIYTNTISLEKLNFSPAESDKIVATINASAEGIRIAGSKIQIDGNVTFGLGYNPTEKIASGGAASDINNNTTTINGGKITTGSITATQIASGTITTNNLNFTPVTGSNVIASINASSEGVVITGSKIQISGQCSFIDGYDPSQKVGKGTAAADVNFYSTTINGGKITTGSITADQIAANTITAAKIAAGTITATEIASNAITAEKILASAVTADKINAGAVTAVKVATNAITADKILAGAVTADKILAGAVTADKLSVTTLSAISGNLGTITAGSISGISISSSSFSTGGFSSGAGIEVNGTSITIRPNPSGAYGTISCDISGGILIDGQHPSFQGHTHSSSSITGGATGYFETADSKGVTVTNGIITNIADI